MKHPVAAGVKVYVPIMDWWVLLVVSFICLIGLVGIPMVIWQPLTFLQSLAALLIIIITVLYVVDIAFFTSYYLEEEGLAVVSQMHYALFPYRTMSQIQQGGAWGLISMGKKKRFALSSRCLQIKLTHGPYSLITVSPTESQEFVEELLQRIDNERSARASVSKDNK